MTPKSKLTEWLAMLKKISDLEKHSMTVDQIRILYSTMQTEGMNLSDHARALDLDKSTISKSISELGLGNGRDRKGMGLIELMPSALNMSHKLAYLTPKGRNLRDQLTKGTGAK